MMRSINIGRRDLFNMAKTAILQIAVSLAAGIILRSFWSPKGMAGFICFAALYLAVVFLACIYSDKELLMIVSSRANRFLQKYKKGEKVKVRITPEAFIEEGGEW